MNLPMLSRGRARDEAEKEPGKGSDSESDERKMFGEAFDAREDGDRDGFIEAMLAGVRACVKSYEDEEEPDGDEG